VTVTETPNVAGAVETTRVASHLHEVPSYDPGDFPVPTGREESWRFTPLKRLGGILEGAPSQAHLAWETELPEGVTLRPISAEEARALGERVPDDRASVLAVANAGGAMLLDIPAEAELTEPVVVRLRGTSAADLVWGHVVVRVGHHARADVVVHHSGSARYATNTSVLVGDSARLNVVSLQDWDDDAVHLGRDAIVVGRDAEVRHSAISFGGLVRLNVAVEYAGPGGSADLLGLYFADAGQHLEHRLFVDHTAPRTRSNVVYKGALQGDGAHTVWIGNVLIRKVAEGIETYEQNRNLVLTEGGRADSVPNLEIETGEIEGAGHASTTGRFDDEQLFYLQSRGIPEDEARRLVVHGFFNDIIRKIGIPSIEDRLMETVEAELAKNVTGKGAVA
jgi:Fe-S cluster assembly protein SufD